MRQRTLDNVTAFFAGVLLFIVCYMLFNEASATGKKDTQEQKQYQDQAQDQSQTQTVNIGGGGEPLAEGGDLSMTTDDDISIDASESNNIENNSSNVVLVPNNNTESCVRVFGLAFGKNGESGAIGFPWRSKSCDYEQAADDAFAAGERELGWFWKCQNKNLYRTFQPEGMSDDEAKLECHKKAVGMASALATIDDLQRRLEASEDYVQFLKEHKEVCDESLERCEQQAYGSK